MIFTRAKKNEIGFLTVLCKLISLTSCCLFGMHVSGQYIRDSIFRESAVTLIVVTKGATGVNLSESDGYIIYHHNTESIASKPFVYIAKGAAIANLSESESYDIINQNVKMESSDVSLKQSSVEKTKQTAPKVSQRVVAKNTQITITYKTIPSKVQNEKLLTFRTSTIVPTCHHHDKNAILNSAFSNLFLLILRTKSTILWWQGVDLAISNHFLHGHLRCNFPYHITNELLFSPI